ncbi:phage tail tape measure protein [Rheinheimera mesophila]|uniref:Phage tail tape measure protein n=2 Tax=Rheinheimera mesophila TaxID=1547515 RepID=A0A3P3QMX0_9GAMM|nr:phage tail tape measure protein [Rheinheimera mesophila]
MSTRSIGNLTLNVIANTGSFEEGATRTERALDKMNKAVKRQKDELQSLIGQIDPVVAEFNRLEKMQQQLEKHKSVGLIDEAAYTRYSAAIGDMRREVMETNSAFSAQQREFSKLVRQIDPTIGKMAELDKMQEQLQQGFSSGLIDEAEFNRLNNTINQSRAALSGIDVQMGKNAMSGRAMNAALRNVPAQFTDIFTSLAGGQDPLLVFLQQGGQLKDMFGGAGPAARALTGYILGLINPLTVAAAGLGVMALAYYQGSIEADKFRQAIVFTGNSTGVTTDSLAEMAKRIDDISGTQRQASAAIAEAATTGKFTSEQLEMVSRSAVLMENTVGKAVSDTVKEFESLAKDPAKSVAELNEKYNFLTADIYEQIVALEKQGKTQDAATLAMNAYAEATEQRTQVIVDNLGYIEQAWKAIKNGSTEAWDSILNLGRSDTLQSQLEEARKKLTELETSPTAGMTTPNQQFVRADNSRIEQQKEVVRLLETQLWMSEMQADGERLQAQLDKESIAAQQKINKLLDEGKSKEEQKAAAIKEYNANLDKIRAADPNSALLSPASVAKGLAAIEEKFKETTKKVSDDSAKVYMMQLAQQEATLREQLDSNQKLGEAQKQLIKFEQQLADIKEKKTLTAQQKSLLAEESAIRTQLQRNVELEREIKSREQINRLTAYQQNLQSEIQAQQQQYGDALANFGMGDRARERQGERNSIERDVQRSRDRSTSDFATGSISKEEYDSQIEMLDEQLSTRLQMMEDYYAREDEMRGDWTNGWDEAWANWSDQVSDIAGQMEDMFTSAFGGLEDALYDFVTTGNFSLSDMLRNMAEETIRMLIRVGAQKLINFALEKTMGTAAAAGYIAQVTGQSTAGVMLAGINAFASTAAIPIVGPGLAPAAMAAATAATSPLAAGAIAAAGSTIAGMAHSGLDYIPKEGTWLLDKGERVLSPRQNQDLTNFLRGTPQASNRPTIEPGAKKLDVHFNLSALNNEGLIDLLMSNRGAISGMLVQSLEDQGVKIY